ncbi:urease accessory protein UreE [Staphylococcus aureus]
MSEEIQGNIADLYNSEKQKHVEKVYLENSDLVKRIQRVVTDHGTEIGIRLKQPIDLQYGDIYTPMTVIMIIVDVNSEDLSWYQPRTLQEMGDIAHQLGNRHLPAQFTETEMLVQYDYLVEDLLKSLGIRYVSEDRKVNKAFRHIGHSHD